MGPEARDLSSSFSQSNQFWTGLLLLGIFLNVLVVFTSNLPEFTPAKDKFPCKRLLGIVTRFDKLLKELLTPVFIGDGSFL